MGINVRLNSSTTVRAYNVPPIPSPYSILSGYASTAGVSTSVIGGIGSITQLSVSGISTLGITSTTNLTAQNINNTGITTTNSLSIGSTQVISSGRQLQNIVSLDATTTATIESAITNAPNTFTDLNITGISTLGVTSTTNLTAQQLNISGVSTFAGISTLQSSLFGTQGSFTGIVTANSFRPSSGYYQSPNGTNSFYVYDGTGNVAFQGTIGASQINSASGYKALDFSSSTTPIVQVTNGLTVGGVTTSPTLLGTNLNYSGIGTVATISGTTLTYPTGNITVGVITNASGTNLNYSGISTLGNVFIGTGNTTLIVTGTARVSGASTFDSAVTVIGSFTQSNGLFNINNTVSNIQAVSQTTGTLTLGGPAQTGTIVVGQSTATSTTNIQAGASGVGTTKTINFGTGGLSGSFTNINIGPGPSAGVGTVVINSGSNLGIGSAIPTSALDVTGSAKVSGVVTATTFSGNVSGTNLNYSGIGTVATLSGTTLTYPTGNITVGVITNASGTNLNYSGIGTVATLSGTTLTYPTGNITVGVITNASGTNLNYSGISTLGNVTIGAGNTTLIVTGTARVSGAATFDGSLTFNNGISVTGVTTLSSGVNLSTTGGNIFANAQTTGNLTLGGPAQTGTQTFGQSTVTNTANYASGASGVGTTKTINLGTGGLTGSSTQINVGPTAGVGTVVINSGSNLGIGSAIPTSALDVTGNVKITGVTTITGNLNAPGNYYVKLGRLTNQTITTGVDTLIGFTTMSDTNGWYAGITTRTTPTVAGTYQVQAMLNWQAGATTNANQSNIQLRKNATTFSISIVGIQTFQYSQFVCGIVTMNGTTDYIDFTAYTSNATSQAVTGDAAGAYTKMEIFKLN